MFIGTQYKVKDCSLYRIKKTNDTEELLFICNFIIIPESEIVKDNGLDVERFFRLKPIHEYKKLESVLISADKFTSMNFIIPSWGLSLRTSTATNTSSFIRDSIQAQKNIRKCYIYGHTGWRKVNNKWFFLYQNGAIGLIDHNISVELEGRLSRYRLSDTGDYIEAAKVAYKTLDVALLEITIPLLSIVHLSILNEFLRVEGIEPSFVLFLLGVTGSMKSTLAALFLNFFGDFDNKSLPGSFKDTSNSLEKQGFLLKDVLFCVDDFHPVGSINEVNKIQSTMQSITRGYGDRTGRSRMNSDTTIKPSYIPKGNLIITAEDIPYNIGQSGLARHFTIELQRNDINLELLTELQSNTKYLRIFMRGYIEWLIPQLDSLPKYLKKQFLALRTEARNSDDQHNRLPETIAHLQIGCIMLFNYFKHLGILDQIKLDEWLAKSWNILLKLAENQSSRINEDKPIVKFKTALNELLETNICYVIATNASSLNPGSPGCIGYCDNEYYYLYPDTTYKEISKFYQSQGIKSPVSKNILLRHLEQEKAIDVDITKKKVNRTKLKKIGSKQNRFIWLQKSFLEND